MQARRTIVLFLFILAGCASGWLNAATITGKITDWQTGEELVGCAVYLHELKMGTTTGFDGTYELKNVPAGSYNLLVSLSPMKTSTKK